MRLTISLAATVLSAAPACAQTSATAADPVPGQDNTPTTQSATTASIDGATAPPKPFTLTSGLTGTSDYRFRGLTQTGGDAALQGTVNLNTAVGFYIGTWASTIDGGRRSRTPLLVGYGSEEIDLYGGFTRIYHGLGLDAGVLYYYYAGHLQGFNTDFFEPYANLGYTIGPVAAKIGANYAWGGQKGLDFRANNSDANLYLYAEGSIGLPRTPLTLRGHVGRTRGSLGLANLDPNDDSYYDWSVTGEAVGGPIKVGVSYVDTSITEGGGFARRLGRGSTVLGYVGLSF
jgi:uncharacterized protein (TIGR02001 family)